MIFSLLAAGPLVVVSVLLAMVIGITVHEFAHAFAGYLQGDMTAKNEGRLTLNPLAHLDPIGSIMLLLAGFGWGRPTPYNPYNLRNPKYGPLIVALFGPLSNLLFALVSFTLFVVFAPSFGVVSLSDFLQLLVGQGNLLMVFLVYLYLINTMLMIFNLLPIPPLDGSQIVFTLLPERYGAMKLFLARNGPLILIAIIILNMIGNVGIFERIILFFITLLATVAI